VPSRFEKSSDFISGLDGLQRREEIPPKVVFSSLNLGFHQPDIEW